MEDFRKIDDKLYYARNCDKKVGNPEESVNRNIDTKFNIKSSVEHLGKVRKAYSSILNENNLIYIDGMKPIEQIFNEVLQKLEEFRKNNAKRIWSTNITIKKMWNL